jgi:hypothetical protein
MPKNDFLDAVALKKKVIEHLDAGAYELTKHAAEEQADDDLDLLDTLHVLRYGAADQKHTEFNTKSQSWRYGIKGKTEDGNTVIVIVAFKGSMIIITVFKVGKNK